MYWPVCCGQHTTSPADHLDMRVLTNDCLLPSADNESCLLADIVDKHVLTNDCLLWSAGNESCPQPQTSEHLAAIEIMKLKHILILQNKIDLVKESQAHDQYEQILKFIQGLSHLLMVMANVTHFAHIPRVKWTS